MFLEKTETNNGFESNETVFERIRKAIQDDTKNFNELYLHATF